MSFRISKSGRFIIVSNLSTLNDPTSNQLDIPMMGSFLYDATSGRETYTKGALGNSDNDTSLNIVQAPNRIGSRQDGQVNSYFEDSILELVYYQDNHQGAGNEKKRIESYLALKYGITLSQTTATDYLASNGATKMWDSAVNNNYNNDIFGIGQDDDSELDQRISKSVNPNTILTASSDTNFTNENTTHADILDNLEFITHANNASGVALALTATDVNPSFVNFKKVNREWNIQEIGNVGCVNYKFDVSGLSLLPSDALFVVIAEDDTFTTNTKIQQIGNSAGEISIDWPANSTNNYMTLAVLAEADKGPELTDTKVGVTTLNTKPLPTASNTYLELMSRDNGMVITRVSTINRTAMTQQPGLFVYDTDLNQFFVSNGTTWRALRESVKFCN